jgi:hypothetical protein
MLSRLQSRQLHKRVFTSRIQEFSDPPVKKLLQDVSKPEQRGLRGRVEEAIAEVINGQIEKAHVDPRLVIVHGFDIKSVRTSSRNDEASIMINRRPDPKPFEQDSTLFASIDEGYADGFVEAYAPVTWTTTTERSRILKSLDPLIRVAIEKVVKDSLPNGGA